MGIAEIIFLVVVAIVVVYGATGPVQERMVKRRAKSLISLDRIARNVDAGENQLSIGLVRKAYKQGDGRGPLKQWWTVPIYFRANGPESRDCGVSPVLKLDGTDDIRAVENELIEQIKFQRQMIQEGH